MVTRQGTDTKINLKGQTPAELEQWLIGWGEPKYRARQLMRWMYRRGVVDFDAMTNLPKALREKLAEVASIGTAHVVARTASHMDEAVKYLFRLEDGERVESVLMREQGRITVCVSSQVGCAMTCDFCATGKMGFFRQLTAAEILDQLLAIARERKGERITNVVFMGMGEPLANYDNLLKAIRLMTHPDGLGLPERRITVSTVGLVPRMRQFAKEGFKCRLAVSLNATTDEIRTRLMPVNARYPIAELLDAAREWALASGERVTLEYVLIRDVNDTVEDAKRLRKLMSRLPCKLNLIPYNEIDGADFRRPELARIERFRRIVADGHYVAPVRFSKGRDVAAACGQLRTVLDRQGVTLRDARGKGRGVREKP